MSVEVEAPSTSGGSALGASTKKDIEMKFLVKLGALSVAAVVLSAGLALAQDNTPEPGAEPGMGGLTEVEEPIIDGGSYGGGHGDSTEAGPGNGDSGDSDSDDAGSDNGDSASFTP